MATLKRWILENNRIMKIISLGNNDNVFSFTDADRNSKSLKYNKKEQIQRVITAEKMWK